MSAESFDPYHRWLGIPPKDQPPDHYRLLGVERFESHPEVISDAADRQMAHLRNHQLGEHAAASQKVLNEVAAARVCLLDPQKKAEYDARLRRITPVRARVGPPAAPLPVPPSPAAVARPSPTPTVPQIRPGAGARWVTRRHRSSGLPVVAAVIAGFLFLGALIWVLASSQQVELGPPPSAGVGREDAYASSGQGDAADRPEVPKPQKAPSRVARARDRLRQSGGTTRTADDPKSPAGRLSPGTSNGAEATLGQFQTGGEPMQEQTAAPSWHAPANSRSLGDLMNEPPPLRDGALEHAGTRFQIAQKPDYHVWRWHLDRAETVRLKFYRDGTISESDESSGDPKFTWSRSGDKLVLRWPQGRVDTVIVSQDGRSCHGVTQTGRKVSGQLVDGGMSRP